MLPRLGLPDWTVTFLIILLIVGFPITIILSWIFDVTPEGVKKTEPIKVANQDAEPVKRRLKVSDGIIAVLIVIVVILAYPKFFRSGNSEIVKDPDGRISITVLPFENLTGDSLYYDWEVGVQNLLINSLSNSNEISVRQPETMIDILSGTGTKNYASITPSIGSEIALKLGTNTFILGNILKAGNEIRISVQLRDASTQEIYRSYEVEGDSEDQIFIMADSLSNLLLNFFEITVLEKDAYFLAIKHSETNSAEAYRYYIQAQKVKSFSDYPESIKLFNRALDKDSSFVSALVWLTIAYINNGEYDLARLVQKRTARYIEEAPLYEQLFYYHFKAFLDKDIQGRIKYATRLTEEFPFAIKPFFALGVSYTAIHQSEKAATAFEELFEVMKQTKFAWEFILVYRLVGKCYHKLGQHTKEQEVYELGLSALPDHPEIIYRQAVCSLSQGDTVNANQYITKFQTIRNEEGYSVPYVQNWTGSIYQEANYLDKAQECYLLAIKSDPGDIHTLWARNNLAYLLIDNDINISEGMILIDQALKAKPADRELLANIQHASGWGLYKQGKLREAYDILIESWKTRPDYNHDHFLHIQEVEQALASQNN